MGGRIGPGGPQCRAPADPLNWRASRDHRPPEAAVRCLFPPFVGSDRSNGLVPSPTLTPRPEAGHHRARPSAAGDGVGRRAVRLASEAMMVVVVGPVPVVVGLVGLLGVVP